MTTNSPFPWLAAAEPTPPHPAAAAWPPPAGVTAEQHGGADGWPPEGLPTGWGPPAPAGGPAAVDDRASGRGGAVARTTSPGWPLPSGALTHHPAADPGEPGGHGVIATVGGRQDPRLADDLASPEDQPATPPAEPWPPRAPAANPHATRRGLAVRPGSPQFCTAARTRPSPPAPPPTRGRSPCPKARRGPQPHRRNGTPRKTGEISRHPWRRGRQ